MKDRTSEFGGTQNQQGECNERILIDLSEEGTMGGRSLTGGVRPKGARRIELEFTYRGKRYRPTHARKPKRDIDDAIGRWADYKQRRR